MIPFFPKQIAHRAIIVYLISLAVVSILFASYAMLWGYVFLGISFVFLFFLLLSRWTGEWRTWTRKKFIRALFIIAVSFRLVWVIVSYFYYIDATGIPFEYAAADSLAYHEEAKWLAASPWSTAIEYYSMTGSYGISDIGYPLYLTILYKVFGPVIIIPRIIKAFLSAVSCVLIYHLATRSFGDETGRMAGLMYALMPNLIIYCGFHLKETEMLFLEIVFLERLDYAIRSRKMTVINIIVPSLVALSLFFFRTVLGAAAIFAFATAILVSSVPTMKKNGRRIVLIAWGLLALFLVGGSTITTEIEGYWEQRDSNAIEKRGGQERKGIQWAKYATGTVMAPMAFILPFSTMVNVDEQYGQQEKHAGNYSRNFMGFFAILAIYEAIRRRKWREFAMIGAFVISYLGVIALSGFSNSERFLLPALPGLILMWSYGVATMTKRTYKFLTPWSVVVVLMEVGWAFFKLGSRGLF